MDYRQELLKEHSKRQTIKIATNAMKSDERFGMLVEIFLAGPYRVTQRAAWPISFCVEHKPEIISPYLARIIKHLGKPGIHDAVKRNTLRLLQFVVIPKQLHGAVSTICFEYLNDTKEPVAVHVFAMTVLANLSRHHPEFKNELSVIIQDRLPYASPAFRSRGVRILKQLNH